MSASVMSRIVAMSSGFLMVMASPLRGMGVGERPFYLHRGSHLSGVA